MCSTRGKPRFMSLPLFWPWLWAGACTRAFMKAAGVLAPLNTPRWRTPQLAEHVHRLKLRPPETLRPRKRKQQRTWLN